MKKKLKPSDLKKIHPWDSVFQDANLEGTMSFIINKMAEFFNEWGINYSKYKEINPETKLSKEDFAKYEKYLKSQDTIRLFSKSYDI